MPRTRSNASYRLTSAAPRRIFGEYQATAPSRFFEGIRPELIHRIEPTYASPYQGSFSHSHYDLRSNPYGRKGRGPGRVRESEATYAYESEDQSASCGVRAGMRLRHAQFGVGSVIACEEHGDDLKITVRFNTVGVKKLSAATRSWNRPSRAGLAGPGNPAGLPRPVRSGSGRSADR